MQRRYLWLAIALAVLLVSAASYVVMGNRLYTGYQTSLAAYTSSCDTLISWNPPQRLYTGLYVNQPNLVNVQYRSDTRQTLRITVGIPQFTQDQTVQVIATRNFQQKAFKPPILGSDVLDALVGPGQREAQVHLRVQSLSSILCDTNVPITLMSRQLMQWYSTPTSDNFAYLAGWVTPDAPAITALRGKAAALLAQFPEQYPDTDSLHGYIGGATANDVREQVDVLFDTLQQDYHVRYSSDNIPFSTDATQRIQLPADVLSQAAPTAMCLETTAILASAVEKLGMRPYIIIIPGHAFLGVALGPNASASSDYWETSLAGAGNTGEQARITGEDEFQLNQQHHSILYVINIQNERSNGIKPIE